MFSHVDLFWRCHYSPNWVVLSSFQCRENFCTTEGFTDSLQSTSFNLIILFGYAGIPTTWCIPHKSHLKWRLKFVWVFSRFCWRFSFMSEILKVLSWELRGIIDNKASKSKWLYFCVIIMSDARFFLWMTSSYYISDIFRVWKSLANIYCQNICLGILVDNINKMLYVCVYTHTHNISYILHNYKIYKYFDQRMG